MRAAIFLTIGLAVWSHAVSATARTDDDRRIESFIQAANNRGDCTGYATLADSVLAGNPGGYLGVRLSTAAAICAARDKRFDLTNRLINHASSKPASGAEVLTRYSFYHLVQSLADTPGAGASALNAARRIPGLDRLPDHSIQSAELHVMAMLAAGPDFVGVEELDRIDRRGALSIQADRRFASAWLTPAELAAVIDRPLKSLTPPLGENWPRDLAVLSRESDEKVVLSAARRLVQYDFWNGDGQRAWLVQRLVEDGNIDEARDALDIEAVGKAGRANDMLFVPGLVQVIEGLIRADRPDEANRLLDWWNAAQAEDKTEYIGFSREDDVTLWPLRALQACLRGDHTSRLVSVDWRVSLACNDPQDRTAALLIEALRFPGIRSQMLQAVNLPPAHTSLGKADDDYRRRWDALLARPDVAVAIERHGRRLPPDLAWRLARAYPAF